MIKSTSSPTTYIQTNRQINRKRPKAGMAAGATIALLPIMLMFLFLQRYYVEGVAGAVKA